MTPQERRDEMVKIIEREFHFTLEEDPNPNLDFECVVEFVIEQQAKAVKEVVEPLKLNGVRWCDLNDAFKDAEKALSKAMEYTEGI